MERASLSYIFFTFLKLGATAFGGYMSLVAIVQKQLVEVDKKLKEEDLLDGIFLTSVLPGPVAVNTIAYVGYHLRGIPGAVVTFAGIIIPSFLLVIFLSWLYFSYGNIPAVKNVFSGITPAITALIVTVAIGMTRKTIKLPAQWVLCLLAALLLIFIFAVLPNHKSLSAHAFCRSSAKYTICISRVKSPPFSRRGSFQQGTCTP